MTPPPLTPGAQAVLRLCATAPPGAPSRWIYFRHGDPEDRETCESLRAAGLIELHAAPGDPDSLAWRLTEAGIAEALRLTRKEWVMVCAQCGAQLQPGDIMKPGPCSHNLTPEQED